MFAGPGIKDATLVGFRDGGAGRINNFHVTGDRAAYEKVSAVLQKGTVTAGGLSRLAQADRKLLWYHNLSDEALTPFMSIARYKQLASAHGGYAKLQENIRLLALPGTGHCGMSGVGPANLAGGAASPG